MATSGDPWIETYRGTVYRWEVDLVGHLTVAYYFQRFEDATLGLLESVGLGPDYMAREGQGCVTVDCYVRYTRELRRGDVLHIVSGVIGEDEGGLTLGHKLFDSESGTICATVEARAEHVRLEDRSPVPLTAEQRRRLGERRVVWDGPARERRPQPRGVEGFRDAARDTVKPWELGVFGQAALSHYIHRFSASGAQTFTAFGMTPAYQRDAERGFSTFEFQLTFAGDLRAGAPVVVKSALLHVGTSSLRIFHQMFDARRGLRVATLDQLGVHLDTAARRPAPLPDALRDKARALLAPIGPA